LDNLSIISKVALRNRATFGINEQDKIMKFNLIKKLKSGIRIGQIKTKHGIIHTPFFMPVGTVGSVKGISPQELKDLGAEIVLANTYHLYLRPGEKIIKKLSGLHKFIGWNGPILTDSGGYQVFSLGNRGTIKNSLVKIKDEGVEFTSHLDGSKHMFTPEKVIQIQLDLSVDILMPLDYCPSGKASNEEIKRSVDITINWAKRSKEYFDKKIRNNSNKANLASEVPMRLGRSGSRQEFVGTNEANRPALFGIVQGGLNLEFRKYCAGEIVKLDFDGYAVGGLAVDHETRNMWGTIELMGEILPTNKPRYLMGVGTPDDILKAIQFGMDMFDCVLPTRLARHGSVYVKSKEKYTLINLLNSKYRTDGSVIDKNCNCLACKLGNGFSKAYISHLIRENEMLGMRLATLHSLFQYLKIFTR
jgi:queuine tRNA-ribosyltransferase